jgi:hypothetical protein
MTPVLHQLLVTSPVIGYIDPGTGSLMLQLLLGGAASLWVVIRLFGRRILKFLHLSGDDSSENKDKQS